MWQIKTWPVRCCSKDRLCHFIRHRSNNTRGGMRDKLTLPNVESGAARCGRRKMPEHFTIESEQMQALARRTEELTRWLSENAPFCATAQRHLEQGTVEQAYWHFGYLCAL